MSDLPGNVQYEELNLSQGRRWAGIGGFGVTPARQRPTLRHLMLLEEGEPSRVALIIRPQVEGESDPEPIVKADFTGFGLVAESSLDGEENPYRMRSNYEWRWWPGDAWAVYFHTAEREIVDGVVTVKTAARISWQEIPGSRLPVGERSDPSTWEKVPRTEENSTAFPETIEAGGAVGVITRQVIITFPTTPRIPLDGYFSGPAIYPYTIIGQPPITMQYGMSTPDLPFGFPPLITPIQVP